MFRVGTFWPIIISLLYNDTAVDTYVARHKTTRRERATIELYSAQRTEGRARNEETQTAFDGLAE